MLSNLKNYYYYFFWVCSQICFNNLYGQSPLEVHCRNVAYQCFFLLANFVCQILTYKKNDFKLYKGFFTVKKMTLISPDLYDKFQEVGSCQEYRRILFFFSLLSYLVCSQIWLNYFVNDHHFDYITKILKKNSVCDILLLLLFLYRKNHIIYINSLVCQSVTVGQHGRAGHGRGSSSSRTSSSIQWMDGAPVSAKSLWPSVIRWKPVFSSNWNNTPVHYARGSH